MSETLEIRRGLEPHLVGNGRLETGDGVTRLALDESDNQQYHNAQLMDYGGLPRDRFPWRSSVSLSLRARFSHEQAYLSGTAGFGWWNDPFVGDRATRVAVGPRVAWFFFGSPPSMLAAREGWTGDGFFAQAMNAPSLPGWLTRTAMWTLKVPGLGRVADAAAGRATGAAEQPLHQIDLTAWHEYQILWRPDGVQWRVDGEVVHRSGSAPRGPLGLVIWIDNQWATLAGDGGTLSVTEPQWLEFTELQVRTLAS